MCKKSLLMMLLFALLAPWAANAQTTVEIGDGTTADYYTPIGTYYNYSITEQLYTAEEIGTAGTISSISFSYASSTAKDFPITVYMANVDAENLSTGISLADADEVFNGTLSVTGAGWATITLDTPFAYDGTSNLLIGVIKDYVYWYSDNTWYHTTTDAVMARYTQNDNNPYDTSTVPGSTRTARPNIQMVITPSSGPVCDRPETFEVSNVTANSATLTWTGGSGTYNVEYKGGTITEWTSYLTNTTATTANLSGLTPGTAYQYRVQCVCGSDVSGWKSVSFSTMFGIPLVEGFGTAIPSGWSIYSGLVETVLAGGDLTTASYGWSFGSNNGVFDNHARVNIYGTSCNYWLVLPTLAMEDNVQLMFDVAYTAYSGTGAPALTGEDDKFVVLANNGRTWEIVRQWDNAGSEYVLNDLNTTPITVAIDLSNYAEAGQPITVAFYGESTVSNADNNLHIDNVSIDYIPACAKPIGLAVNYEGGTEATISWTSDAEAWNMRVNGVDVNGVITNPYTLTGLELSTTYEVEVQANCGDNGVSEWVGPVSFTTDLCMPENMCAITIEVTDAYGDGGGQIQVVDVLTNEVLGTYTNSSSSTTYTLNVCEGREINFVYASTDSWSYENGWVITDINNEIISEHVGCSSSGSCDAPTNGVIANYTMSCTVSTCRRPTDLAASEVGPHSAVLSWTENGEATAWVVEVIDMDGGQITNWDANTNPFTIPGLAPETNYKVRVRPVCSDFDDKWSESLTFTTDVACPAPTNVAISNVEPFAATVSWNGSAENYNLRYRAARGFNYGFETAEGFVVDEFPPCTTYDGDGLPTYGIDGYTMPNNTANYVGSVVSFNEYWAAHSGNVMGVFMDAIPDTEAGITANDDYFILPELTIAAGDHFIFWARSVTANYGLERMKVGIYGGNGTISTYFAGSADTYVEVPVDWTKYDYDLTAYVGQTIQLAINCVSADAFALLFDDLFVGDPTDDTWDQTLTNVTSPYTLTGLNEETMYEVQVQAACGGDDGVSEWVGATFTTPSNCAAPTNLAANDITPNAATLSWEGFHDSYNLQYRTPASRETYYFNDFNTDLTGWTYPSYIYGIADPIYNVAGSENYFLAMGWSSTTEETIISCELPAYERGAYVEFYYFGYQTANTFQVGYSTTTNDAEAFTWGEPIDAPLTTYTRYQETLADGVKYVAFKATASSQYACVFIDDFGIFGADIPAGAWQTRSAVTSPYSLTGLANDTEYEWQVQGINTACEGGVTEWSNMANFTTLNACMVPVIDSVNNVEATTATVSWTGVQDSYNVKYGAYETMAFINFDDGVIPTSFTNDTVYAWALTDALTDEGYCIKSSNEGVASSSSTISLTATFETAGMIVFDAMFMGEGTSTIYDKCIFSIDGNQQFSYGQIGEVWNTMGYNVAAGEHTFTWTYSKDSSVNPTGDFFALDNIMLITNNITWTTIEGVTGNSYNMTGLTPNSLIAVQVQGNNTICNDGVTDWSDAYLFITGEQTTVTQTLALGQGANWVSFNVDITLNDLKAALVAALPSGNTTTVTIKSQTQDVKYNRGRWVGQLTALDMAQMYLITVSADCEISFEGMPLDPTELAVTINNGSNWIAYPYNVSMTVTNLFTGFAVNNDQVKSQTNDVRYNRGRWVGQLTTLEPGKGYIYISANTDPRTFTFPAPAKAGQKGIQKPMKKLSNQIDRKMQNAVKLVLPCK